jgi:hypothetical protein
LEVEKVQILVWLNEAFEGYRSQTDALKAEYGKQNLALYDIGYTI